MGTPEVKMEIKSASLKPDNADIDEDEEESTPSKVLLDQDFKKRAKTGSFLSMDASNEKKPMFGVVDKPIMTLDDDKRREIEKGREIIEPSSRNEVIKE